MRRSLSSYLLVEIAGVFKEKPAGTFQDILLELVFGFPVEVPSEIGQLVVEELHYVEMVEHNNGPGKMLHHGAAIGRGHVDGNGVNRCLRMLQPFPEWFQRLLPLCRHPRI